MNDVQTQSKPSGGTQKSAGSGGGPQTVAYRSAYPPPEEQPTRKEVVADLEAERDAQAEFNAQAHEEQAEAGVAIRELQKKAQEELNIDPDQAREDAEELAESESDPKKKAATAKAIQELRAKKFPQPRTK